MGEPDHERGPASGNADAQTGAHEAPPSRDDEIAVLREQLAEKERALLQLSRRLEEVVAQRTAQLRESEERYRLIAEHSSDMILLADGSWRTIYLSPSVRPILGYDPSEWLGNYFTSVLHPDDLPALRVAQAQLARVGRVSLVCRLRRANGSWCWIDAIGTTVQQNGVRRYVAVARDISERRALEAQLRHAQKMEGLGRLAGGIAHDFNNLLVVISGCAELASSALVAQHPIQEDLREIQHASLRATALTRQLLAFARRQIADPQQLSLNYLIAEMGRLLQRLLRADIALQTDLPPSKWQVRVDPSQIEQVVVNLALNAQDAMPSGGKLTIGTQEVTLHESEAAALALPAGDYVTLHVTDTGSGMSEEVQGHLFEPFFTTKPTGKGSGLGLPVCYGILQQHGGAIAVDSAVGRGTTVRLYLPRDEEGAGSREGSTPSDPGRLALPRGSETVLLVEDDDSVRVLSARVLREQGYTVLVYERSDEALEAQLGNTDIALLLTDLVMPTLDGRSLAVQLTAQHPGLRVIFMSGYVEEDFDLSSIAARAVFLEKPFTPATLVRRVRELLDQ
jgi:two-component system cell cycle sensor histidine kinase/response regulator CckA